VWGHDNHRRDLLKRFGLLTTAVLAVALTVAVSAGAASSAAKVSLRKTSVGMILVNSKGFTVYAFSKDSKNKDACVKISGCVAIWPPLTTAAKPIAGSGVKASLLGTIPYKGNLKQVTYAGHPLYMYSSDSSPGSTSYVNQKAFGGRWPAVNAAGKEIT
jgi:predicted lipoprotein with Yx(FWY)xxD motif